MEISVHEVMQSGFETEELQTMPERKVTIIAENGLGYGHGAISGNLNAQPELKAALNEAMQSPELLVAVDIDEQTGAPLDDDGCGDGRGVKAIFLNGVEAFKRSLNRAKVFGGGATMAAATRIGLGLSKDGDLHQTFKDSIGILGRKKVDYGAHTADQVSHEAKSGCGAIDEAPEIIASAVRYEDDIRGSLQTMGVQYDGVDADLLEVFGNFRTTAEAIAGRSYSGRNVMSDITHDGKVVKQLAAGHLEKAFIYNKVRGYTVNQDYIRRISDGQAQTFAVDGWRLEDIAQRMYSAPEEQRKALLSELVYTLATAAVLTRGDLPVVVVEDVSRSAV